MHRGYEPCSVSQHSGLSSASWRSGARSERQPCWGDVWRSELSSILARWWSGSVGVAAEIAGRSLDCSVPLIHK